MGIITGKWSLPPSSLPRAERFTPSWVADRLREATGLPVAELPRGVVHIPALRQKLFDWIIDDDAVSVDGYAPAHPYLWENLNAVMIEAGCSRSEDVWRWQANPLHLGLRKRWAMLSARDRFILSRRAFMATRILDRWL